MRPGLLASLFGSYPDPATQPLRFVGADQHVNNTCLSRTAIGYVSYVPVDIGSGDVSRIRLSFHNWYINATNVVTNSANTVPIQAVSLQYNGVSVPVTFSGGRTVTLSVGANDVQSDEMGASAWGVSVIPRGARMWAKIRVLLGATSDQIPCNSTARSGGMQSWWYNPASTTIGNDVDVLGAFTYTGAAPQSRVNVMTPWVLGKFVVSDPPVWLHHGDSISQSLYDTGTNLYGDGWFARSMHDAFDTPSSLIAHANFGVSGTSATSAYADARIMAYYKYATRGSFMYGANDFGSNGLGVSVAVMQARANQIISNLRTYSGTAITKVVAGYTLPRTNSTDLWSTSANQTVVSGWDAGGNPDLYNAWLSTLVGSSLDAVYTFPGVRDAGNSYKWLTNGVANAYNFDAVHPDTGGHIQMALDGRSVVAAIA